jgi:8-oxo-dGTP pyrophosphatase MutT (NUDIX family)
MISIESSASELTNSMLSRWHPHLVAMPSHARISKRALQVYPQRDWWVACGGRMMPGETPQGTIQRLLRRELDLHVSAEQIAQRCTALCLSFQCEPTLAVLVRVAGSTSLHSHRIHNRDIHRYSYVYVIGVSGGALKRAESSTLPRFPSTGPNASRSRIQTAARATSAAFTRCASAMRRLHTR